LSDNETVMRCKAILSIVAFLSAFGLSVAVTPRQPRPQAVSTFVAAPYAKKKCASANAETARRITGLLRQDIENGHLRDRKINDLWERGFSTRTEAGFAFYAATVNEYTEASVSLDDSDLPGDFRAAWRRHMDAWKEHADFLNTVKDAPAKFSGSYSRKYSEQNKEISETWYEVLRVARELDADIPPGAY
jgi:hypothetical protein